MAQVINTNSLSLITQNNINKNQSALSSSIERLSSGLRINSAKDDAAGQAIANRFTSNIKGLTQAARNANDGISLAQTTEGALSEINNNLQRVRELTVQATTGTNSDSDLSSIQDEIKSRLDEIDRVSGQTQFNGVNVLAKDAKMNIQVGANDGQTITIDLKQIDSSTLKLKDFSVSNQAATTTANVTNIGGTPAVMDDITFADDNGASTAGAKLMANADKSAYIVTTSDGKSYDATVSTGGVATYDSTTETTATVADFATAVTQYEKTAATGGNAPSITNGATGDTLVEAQKDGKGTGEFFVKDAAGKFFAATVNETDGTVVKGDAADLSAKTKTTDPLKALDDAISNVDKLRSSLGAVQNRLDSAVTNLNNTTTNLSEAQSRIQDADYATEVSNMSKAQIIQQAGNSVLSKANQVPQQIMSLLQG
ncbi:flagellin [Klebsiella sp. RIT-PI-d]|uniref:FliC/FljB family flagellin n=1 Tax=Klebsiella sp. RIT-PI-d TaxID=1681196 RepID=UPI000675CCEC|nr:FliC/FljB family flagellin [Klebsiella sp. RIT-PI-d]KNC09732.1 flagellin [Klebsiella sp. RIT-PI-d]